MTQQQAQPQWTGYAAWSQGSRPRPGKLLLGDIQQSLQQHNQLSALRGPTRPHAAANELATLALAPPDDSSSTSSSSSSSTETEAVFLTPQGDQQAQQAAWQSCKQQQQGSLPFWKGAQQQQLQQSHSQQSPLQQQQQHNLYSQQEHQQQLQQPWHEQQQQLQQSPSDPPAKAVTWRQGGIGPQFASATLSGSNGGGSNGSGGSSDHHTALKAVGRVFGNGEICKLLGVVGAQLLMHWATLQHGMHQLQQRQQGLSPESAAGQQQQHQGWGPFRLRLPWQRPEGQGGAGEGGHHQGSGRGGGAAWQAGEAAKQWVARGIAAERNIQLREALACYTNAVTLEPANREYLCRVAKQWSDLTYEEGATVEQIQEVNSKAMEYAERVVAMAPKSADGYLAACVSKGRLALFSDNKTKVRLAKEAQEAARTAVELDPSNDLAHHLMGRWHFEMAQINFVLRQLIRIVYGAALNPGTFDEALTEFQQAVALNPNKLIHRVELGRTHLRLGHKRDAYAHLLASMDLEVEDVNAKLQKEDAELLLAKLQAEMKGRPELPASWGGFTAPGIAQPTAASAGVSESSSSSSIGRSSADASCIIEELPDDTSSKK